MDSNRERITNPTEKSIQFDAYAGANISHILDLVYRVFESMKYLLMAALDKFPVTEIYVTKVPISEHLELRKQ